MYKRQDGVYLLTVHAMDTVGNEAEPVSASFEIDQTPPTAVSYTHLRAHETVLDLVCRLLLEKKKNNTRSS